MRFNLLIISHKYKFIFLNCRKVAGSSITAYLNHFLGPDGSHYSDIRYQADETGHYDHTYESHSGTAVGTWEYYGEDETTGITSPPVYYEIY